MTRVSQSIKTPSAQMTEEIAIIGLGAIFPGRPGLNGYWSLIKSGQDAFTGIPPSHWSEEDYYNPDPKVQDRTYSRRGAFISPLPFPPLKFGITPKDLPAIDSTQLLGLVAADEALKDAGYPADKHDHSRTSVIVGVTGALKMVVTLGSRLAHPQLKKALYDSGLDEKTAQEVLTRFAANFTPWQEVSFPGLLGNVVAGRIANRLNLGGANMVVDAACASSLAAVRQAVLELQSGRADLVVSGGLDTFNDPFMFTCFSKTPALSPTGELRAFDQNGDGTMLGEGLGVIILKRHSEALKDHDRIYALIKSVGASSDGRGTAIFAPSPKGQLRALASAYEEAGISPLSIGLVEAHGTGTAVGDAAELKALTEYYGKTAQDGKSSPWCALGSVKSQIGHTKAAAGVAGLIKAALSLYHKTLPPTAHATEPLSDLKKQDTPFYLNTQTRPWLAAPDAPRRAAVSAFGFGGSNFHCLLEESADPKPLAENGLHLGLLSGRSLSDLILALKKLAQAKNDSELGALCLSLNQIFDPSNPFRLSFCGRFEDLSATLAHIGQALEKDPETDLPQGFYRSFSPNPIPPLLFSLGSEGQQIPGMYQDLALSFPVFHNSLSLASSASLCSGETPSPLGLLLYPPALAPATIRQEWQKELSSNFGAHRVLPALETAAIALFKSLGLVPQIIKTQGLGSLSALYGLGLLDEKSVAPLAMIRAKDLSKFKKALEKTVWLTPCSSIDLVVKKLLDPNLDELVFGPNGEILAKIPDLKYQIIEIGFSKNTQNTGTLRLSAENSTESLAHILAALSAQGHRINHSAWPIFPPVPEQNADFTIMLSGANQQALPEQAPKTPPEQARKIQNNDLDLEKTLQNILDGQDKTIKLLENLNSGYEKSPEKPIRKSFLALDQAKRYQEKQNHQKVLSSPATVSPDLNSVPMDNPWNHLVAHIAAETGYPKETLKPEMDLERDLGLDSIKKVELLASLTEIFPTLASSFNSQNDLTLGELAQKCQGSNGRDHAAEARTYSPADIALASPPIETAPPESSIETLNKLFEVISTETGYPVDSLNTELSLENDLGLDSIKKVEIMAALTEQFPQQNLDSQKLNAAQTLEDLAVLLAPKTDNPTLLAPLAPMTPLAEIGPLALEKDLLAVIAQETGYPAELLTPEMSLEEDLGLDSIKKVEILSALAEKRPVTSEEQTKLSLAQTLGEWNSFFSSQKSSPPQQDPQMVPQKFSSGRDLLDQALAKQGSPSLWQVVPQKFSYADFSEWPKEAVIYLVGEGSLAQSLKRELISRNYEVKLYRWQYDFSLWPKDNQPKVLFLVWPGPDRNPELITLALKALENCETGLISIVGLSFLGGFFGFPKPGAKNHPMGNSASGALTGLLKCAALEWPKVAVRVLDLPLAVHQVSQPDYLVAILEGAMVQGPVELGLPAANQSFSLTLSSYQPTESEEPLLSPGQTVVVTGGGRGVTAAVLLELAKNYRPHLVILGRTPLGPPEPGWLASLEDDREIKEALHRLAPDLGPRDLAARTKLIVAAREIRKTLADLTEAGALVDYLSGDFTDTTHIEKTARQIRSRYGPIHGFIHGAGILADHPIHGKNQLDFARVYGTKTHLASLFLEAFQAEPLKLVVFFSSSTARFGRQGQADYAAGNEVLNKSAWELAVANPDCRVLALNWGPWAGGMVTPTLAGQFKSQGVGLIGLKEGAETFVRLIKAPAGGPAEVVILGPGTNLDSLALPPGASQ